LHRLRDDPNDLSALIALSSAEFDLPDAWVEKDFWLTEVVRSIAEPAEGIVTILKGGTSLSKAFGLIERFSEDVDVLVEFPGGLPGKNAIHRKFKEIGDRVAAHLDIEASMPRVGSSETGRHRDVWYPYGSDRASAGLSEGVLLEIGIRGGATPREERSIISLVAEAALERLGLAKAEDYEEFAPISIQVLSPVRTLIEKLSLLHHAGVTFPEKPEILARSGRHLYDVFMVLGDPVTLGEVRLPGKVIELTADVERNSAEWGWPFTPRPDAGFARSPLFDPDPRRSDALRSAYEDARGLIYGSVPSIDECVGRIAASADFL
jgi:hypothetical protein